MAKTPPTIKRRNDATPKTQNNHHSPLLARTRLDQQAPCPDADNRRGTAGYRVIGGACIVSAVELTVKTPATEWTVFQGKTCSVQIKAWRSGMGWGWNVYALIFDGHPLHQNVDAALNLPFHWGATFDKRIVTSPAQGIQYDWEKVSDCLKIGSDYMHCDDHHENDDPKDGIPSNILRDAKKLAQELHDRAEVQS
jgi:hypothetical protein